MKDSTLQIILTSMSPIAIMVVGYLIKKDQNKIIKSVNGLVEKKIQGAVDAEKIIGLEKAAEVKDGVAAEIKEAKEEVRKDLETPNK